MLEDNLQKLLTAKGLSPSAFARQIGLKPSTILRILSGTTVPRPSTVATIANYFNISSNQLLGEDIDLVTFNQDTPIMTKRLVPLLDEESEFVSNVMGEIFSPDNAHSWVSLPFSVDSDNEEYAAVIAKDSALKPDIRVGDVVYLRFGINAIEDIPDGSYVFAKAKKQKDSCPILRKFVKGKNFDSSYLVSTNPEWPKEVSPCDFVSAVVIGRSGRL